MRLLEAGQFGENFVGFPRGPHFVGVKFCCRTIVCMLQRDWSVYEKGNWPTSSSRTVKRSNSMKMATIFPWNRLGAVSFFSQVFLILRHEKKAKYGEN